jgi:cyclin T
MSAAADSRQPAASARSVPPSPASSPRPAQPNFFRPRIYSKQQVEDDAPSVKAGMTVKRAGNFRKQYVTMINNVCKMLKLNSYVYGTAVTFCHHFYLVRTLQKNDKMLVAMAAVFLASKSENHPRSLDDVLHASFKEQYGKDREQALKMASMMKDRQQHDWLRDSVLKAERALLYVLGFRFQVDPPAAKLLEISASFKLDSFYKPTASAATALSQIAANFVNDMWRTTLCLQYSAEMLAAGCLYAAVKVTHTEVPLVDGKPWYEVAAGATHEQMEALDAELMKMYTRVPVAAKGSGKGGAAGKTGAGAKPAAGGKLAAGGKPAAAQANGDPQQSTVHVPPAPGTPVSACATPVQRLGTAGRERTPEEARGSGAGGEPSAKRPRTDGGAAPAAAQQPAAAGIGSAAATANGAAAARPPIGNPALAGQPLSNGVPAPAPNGMLQHAPASSSGGAQASSSAVATGRHNGSVPAVAAAPAMPAPASLPPGLAADAPAPAQPGTHTLVHRAG